MNKFIATPLIAAFFYGLLLVGCVEDQSAPDTTASICAIDTTAIASVQGNRTESPMVGQKSPCKAS